jgi:adenylosuccinate lyase
MASHMIDSLLYMDSYGTPVMREIFDDRSMIQNWLDIEAALAQSQADMGIIPRDVAREISGKAKVENLDLENIRKGIMKTGHSLVPTLREFERRCEGGAGEYIHLGATTQDIIDTGYVLAARKAFDVLYGDLWEIEEYLLVLAEEHKNTVMAGRTHGQQALPITFGYKAAIWASEVHRHLGRMRDARERIFVGQLSGAVGTLAGFGDRAIELQEKVLARLGLGVPDISWHASRDRLVEMVNLVAMVAGTFGKIGNEIYSLQKTEVAELAEPFTMGQVGSSTMPHKRNPGLSESMHTLSKVVKANALLAYEALLQEHERDGAYWKTEHIAIPEAFILTGAILQKAKKALNGLVVNKQKMIDNLDILKGLLLSEPVMLMLGEKMGKQTAHEVVYEISMKTFEEGASFKENLLKDPRVGKHFTEEEIAGMLDPFRYTGQSAFLAERVVRNIRAGRLAEKGKG